MKSKMYSEKTTFRAPSISMADLFCGAGGSSNGMLRAAEEVGAEVRLTAVNHWDVAIATHSANHPGARHFCRDLDRVKPFELVPERAIDILWASPSCFAAGTLVLTGRGLLPIETVTVGDLVLTHRGRWRPVTKTMKATKATVTVKGQGHSAGIITTAEHPFLTRTRSRFWNNEIRNWAIRLNDDEAWTAAEGLDGKFWATPRVFDPLPIPEIVGVRSIAFDEAFWRIVGRWLGDGSLRLRIPDTTPRPEKERDPAMGARCRACGEPTSASKRARGRAKLYCNDACAQRHSKRTRGTRRAEVHIVCGKAERAELCELIGVGVDSMDGHSGLRWREVETRTAYRYESAHTELTNWLHNNFGEYAHGKRLPAWTFGMKREWRAALLEGYVSADGYDNGRAVRAVSVSRALAIGVRLLAESLEKPCGFYDATRGDTAQIEGRTVNTRPIYEATWLHVLRTNTVSDTPLHRWSAVRSVESGGPVLDVYNLSVSEDESYVADGIVVHNCTEHSYAKGGHGVDDQKRESAWSVPRMAEAWHPKIIIVENVRQFAKWGPIEPVFHRNGKPKLDKKGNQVYRPIKARAGETFRAWFAAVEACGYTGSWELLNAADYGEAQTRIRLFMVFVAPGVRWNWPEPTHARRDSLEVSAGIRSPWVAARTILDASAVSQSIFDRDRPLAENTMRRIEAGIRRYCSEGVAEAFLVVLRRHADACSLDGPTPTVVANGGHLALAEPSLKPFVLGQHGGSVARGIESPLPTIATDGAISLIEPFLVDVRHGEEDPARRLRSVEDPIATVTAKNGAGIVEPFIASYYGAKDGEPRTRSLDEPLPTIPTENRFAVVEPFLVAHFGEREGQDPRTHAIDEPLPTVTHRGAGDLVEPCVVPANEAAPLARVIEIDGRHYVLDVRFRMLQPNELALAQGFPPGYIFEGTKGDQTAQIGNAVAEKVAYALGRSAMRALGITDDREAAA